MSFRSKTILGIALIEAVLLLILVISSLDFLRSTNEEALFDRAETLVRSFAALTKDPVIASDLATLDTVISEILREKDLVYVRVRDVNGDVLVEGGDTGALERSFRADPSVAAVDDGELDIFAEVTESGIAFGRIEIGVSTSFIANIIEDARRWFATIAGIELVLTALFSFGLGTYLTRQLSVLRDVTQKIAGGEFGVRVPVSGKDEIAETARAFNVMSASLEGSYEALDRQRMETKAIVDNVADAIIVFDATNTILSCNRAAARIFEFGAEDVTGRRISDLIPDLAGEDIGALLQPPQDSPGGGRDVLRRQFTGRRMSGTDFALDLAVSCVESEPAPRFAGIIRDITQALKAEQEMRLSKLVFENSGEAITVTDADHRMLAVNPTFRQMFCYSPFDVIGKQSDINQPEVQDPAIFEMVRRALAETGRWSGEVQDRRKNGESFPRWLTLTVVKNEQGGVSNYVGISRDMTEQKRVGRMKSEFVSTVSHELRTPLTSIKGSLNLVASGALGEIPDKVGELIAIASRNCDRLDLLINDILDMEKVESGAMELLFEPITAGALLAEAVTACGGYAEARGIRFEIIGDPPEAPFVADKGRIMQVMANLMSNAAKFSPDNSRVELRAQTRGSEIRISVSDHGSGIPEEFRSRLFEKFTQADATDARAKGGTGLGLSITKAIIEKHGGTIHVDSTEGVGTTFHFELPLRRIEGLSLVPQVEHGATPPPSPRRSSEPSR